MKEYIYLCGPTVYNKVHVGNMRPIITFDLIVRGLKYLNPNIVFIHNITDIDDKIVNQAQLENKDELEISNKYYLFYLDMLNKYNVQTIDHMPKVSNHIEDIVDFIEKIKNEKYAYEINQSIYFDTSKFKDYGKISNNNLKELKSTKDEIEQKNEFDFSLWKNKTNGKTWKTLLGQGRPGWHTECAVFIDKFTNSSTLKIHGGGIDLKFPHHENENAQYEIVNKKPISDSWLHIGTINVNKQKMSKSIQNIILADEFLEKYNSDLYRLLILSTSIHGAIEINDQTLHPIQAKLNQIERIINHLILNNIEVPKNKNEMITEIAQLLSKQHFAQINKMLNFEIKKFNETKEQQHAINVFLIVNFLGFLISQKEIDEQLKNIYKEFKKALSNKDFKTSDELRKTLIEHNLI